MTWRIFFSQRLARKICPSPKDSGYSGLVAIIKAMTMTEEIRKMVIQRSSAQENRQLTGDNFPLHIPATVV